MFKRESIVLWRNCIKACPCGTVIARIAFALNLVVIQPGQSLAAGSNIRGASLTEFFQMPISVCIPQSCASWIGAEEFNLDEGCTSPRDGDVDDRAGENQQAESEQAALHRMIVSRPMLTLSE
ncbi:MAG: hypothetical protein L0219_17970 [Phycisphaerales bacterium]|nr:hypothetical protein [Phycisphaerales bacterium]